MKVGVMWAFGIIIVLVVLCIIQTCRKEGAVAKSCRNLLMWALFTVVMENMTLLGHNLAVSNITLNLYYASIDWLVLAMFYFNRVYTEMDKHRHQWIVVLVGASFVDTVSFVINMFSGHIFTMVEYDAGKEWWFYRATDFGLAFYLHLTLSYILVAICIVPLIVKLVKTPIFYWQKYLVVLLTFLATVVINGIGMKLNLPFDLSIYLYSVAAMAVCYYAVFYKPQSLIDNTLALVVADMNDAVFCFDYWGKSIFLNHKAEEFFPNTVDTTKLETLHNEWIQKENPAREDNICWSQELEVSGEFRHFFISYRNLYDKQNKFIGDFIILCDRTEEQLVQRAFSEAAEASDKANRIKSEFLAHMSHDIRTPMNGILGMLDLMDKNIDNTEYVMECMKKTHLSAQQLMMLINDVLDMSKVASGEIELDEESINLLDILKECVEDVKKQLVDTNIVLQEPVYDVKHKYLIGSDYYLKQVLRGILTNAVRFNKEDGTIHFEVHELGVEDNWARMRFEIEDTGIGMDKEFLGRLFEPFSQENDNSRTTFKGAGLGLSICKKIVELMNGTIEVESEQGKGTKVVICIAFPIDLCAVEDEETEELPEFEMSDTAFEGMKVLVVEDNPINLVVAQCALDAVGIEVMDAENGEEAIKKFEQSKEGEIDLILMDIMMPVMDGLEASRNIRKLERSDGATVPIVALTANTYPEDIKKSLAAGMNEHLSKPLDTDKLYQTLAHYYSKAG